MFIVMLKFSENKSAASQFMEGHNAWLKQGFEDKVFMLAGSIKPGLGGAVLAHGVSLAELEHRVSEDPFVSAKVVSAEIVEISPNKTDERLSFLTM